VQPEALVRLTNLRSLSLGVTLNTMAESSGRDLMNAASQLKLLTELHYVSCQDLDGSMQPRPTGAFTALTASSNLCSLQLGLLDWDVPIG
jgi:hypothetical protein